jgi:flagellar basal-body rod modification protein FlgD
MATIGPAATASSVVSGVTSSSSTSSTASASGLDKDTIAGNFQTFLTLLTTQLKNQNPMDPLDTNQFTAQLVQFAQVEQQLKSNDQLTTLVSLQQTAQNTAALDYVGQKVDVDGNTTVLANGEATWQLSVPKPVTATITVTSSSGVQVYSGTRPLNTGTQTIGWDGKDTSGLQWPDGNYTISVAATDASGQPVSVPTQIEAVVDSADLTKTPPVLSIAGQDYTVDKIKRVIRTSN